MIRFVLTVLILFQQYVFAQAPSSAAPTSAPTQATTAEPAAQTENAQSFDLSPQIDYVYDPTGKKDPFKPYRAPRLRGDNRPQAPIDPLANVEVTQLRLVAVIWNTPKPRAVVTDPQNRNFILFKNMRVGRNEGVVVDIREGEVVIVEKFDDGFGNTVREARILDIKPTDKPAGG